MQVESPAEVYLPGSDERAPVLGVVTVNWNGWRDTLECLEAIFRMRESSCPVVVIDNGSSDGSLDRLIAWANGELCVVPESKRPQIRRMVIPPVLKPIPFRILTPGAITSEDELVGPMHRLYLVDAGGNVGYAAANNLGMKLMLKIKSIDLVWLINNDALPREDALMEIMVAAVSAERPLICGSALLEYAEPETVQALGGRYSVYFGTSTHIMAGAPASSLNQLEQMVLVDYPVGAAMLVDRSFLHEYGMMSEDYFLYQEEIDWVLRKGWPPKAYAVPRSIVYHKGGSATAAGRDPADRSLLADYYTLRNRLLLAKRVSMTAFLFCALLTPLLITRRILRRRKGLVMNAVKAVRDGLLGRSGKRREHS